MAFCNAFAAFGVTLLMLWLANFTGWALPLTISAREGLIKQWPEEQNEDPNVYDRNCEQVKMFQASCSVTCRRVMIDIIMTSDPCIGFSKRVVAQFLPARLFFSPP